MLETAYILENAVGRSLVIVDELGRGTNTRDGAAIAWAVAEALISRPEVHTLFVTHYVELFRLATLYTSAKCYHLHVRPRAISRGMWAFFFWGG